MILFGIPAILKDQNISLIKVLSFILAALGLVVLFGFENLSKLGGNNRIEFFSQVFVLLAALCYGVNSIVSKLVPKINFISLATGTTIASTIIISPFAFVYELLQLLYFEDVHNHHTILELKQYNNIC